MGNPAGVRRDFAALERRRMQAARLLEKGYSQSEVARRVGAHRQSVGQWAVELREKGRVGLKKAGRYHFRGRSLQVNFHPRVKQIRRSCRLIWSSFPREGQ